MPSNMIIVVLLVATFSIGTSYAQSSTSCTTALVSLSPCLNYISGNDTAPSGSCCSQLASVVKSEPQCLCTVLNGDSSGSLGVTINETRALDMPGACKVTTPSASKCSGNNGPTSSSTPSSTTSTVAGNGSSKNVPTTFVSSAAIFHQTSFHLFIVLLIMASSIITA